MALRFVPANRELANIYLYVEGKLQTRIMALEKSLNPSSALVISQAQAAGQPAPSEVQRKDDFMMDAAILVGAICLIGAICYLADRLKKHH